MVIGKATDLIFNRFPSLVVNKMPELLWYLSHSTTISNNLGDPINRLNPLDLIV